jgi:hypothetical protein
MMHWNIPGLQTSKADVSLIRSIHMVLNPKLASSLITLSVVTEADAWRRPAMIDAALQARWLAVAEKVQKHLEIQYNRGCHEVSDSIYVKLSNVLISYPGKQSTPAGPTAPSISPSSSST